MLRTALNDALKDAMRARDQRRVSTLRMVLAKLKDSDIAARPGGNADGIGEDEIKRMLQGTIKQRRDSIALYEQGGRPELARQEQEEIAVIEGFLPQQLGDDQVRQAVRAIITETGAQGPRDMGKVMTELRSRYSGQMDFGKASGLVKEMLSKPG
jgi:uncharacterized protein